MGALQLKAVALALGDFPDLNGFWRDGAYHPAPAVHAGVAISLRQGGLVAPAIHDVAELALDELMKALSDLVRRARAGSLRSSEMSDPTITITNLGDTGVDAVFPIIYPPQVAIVGFGAVKEGKVVVSLGADHRASDGRRGALFLAELARRLQEPEKL
jgi:pyruvate dehydrogenase E2 component (dihydrolipoamide acetyltransferase)